MYAVAGVLAFHAPRLDEWRARVAHAERIADLAALGGALPAPAPVAELLRAIPVRYDERWGRAEIDARLDAAQAAAVAAAWSAGAALGAEGELFFTPAGANAPSHALHMGRPGPRLVTAS
jgi:hypothetical protein